MLDHSARPTPPPFSRAQIASAATPGSAILITNGHAVAPTACATSAPVKAANGCR